MKFEEQFPSLKGKAIRQYYGEEPYKIENSDEDDFVRIHNVQTHCVDKNKVREAIDKNIKSVKIYIERYTGLKKEIFENIKEMFIELKKELNL